MTPVGGALSTGVCTECVCVCVPHESADSSVSRVGTRECPGNKVGQRGKARQGKARQGKPLVSPFLRRKRSIADGACGREDSSRVEDCPALPSPSVSPS
ncbi:hypothetical protein M440DRAFT_1396690 [Trichoderma longibrachiatum ATCC 18648]|uniref:Uncharacterized protein n=1 Tax=Trichoderma longibrachiatum ATCC 18648 TaxID=983965 RepID=A0A2T4CIY1_TRILO|nr:hypothetical protein M440DRAFT_1396690 [Trichoderma longibrachiatum ATCC 18648]